MSSDLQAEIRTIIDRRAALARGLIADRASDTSIAANGFDRFGALLTALGNPHLAVPTAHIAGSKGKGTTAHLLAGLLAATGRTTGLYTSPHVLRWNERIAINGAPIPDRNLLDLLRHVDAAMRDLETDGTVEGSFNAFDLLTAAAFVAFRESGCETAVIEVGLGGRFDPTNHVQPEVTVITTIELEHTDILGPDLATIAWNKAGIIKPGVPVVCQRQAPSAMDVIDREASELGAPLLLEGRDWTAERGDGASLTGNRFPIEQIPLRLPGPRNVANLGAAMLAASFLVGPDELAPDVVRSVASAIEVPGRFTQITHPGTGQRFVLDVAHTAQSLDYLVGTISELFGAGRTTFAVSFLDDKPWPDLIRVLAANADSFMFPFVPGVRAVPPDNLAQVATAAGIADVATGSIDDVVRRHRADGSPIVITGSFGIVSEALKAFEHAEPRKT